jgi:hypothetical protein
VSWSIVMVENPIVWAEVQAFLYAQLHVTPSVLPHKKLS